MKSPTLFPLPVRAALLLAVCAAGGGFTAEGGAKPAGYYEKEDLPNAPFSDAAHKLKEMPMGAGFFASLGGSWQARYQNLDNRRDLTFNANDEDASVQSRTRLSLDIHNGHLVRFFLEAQDAHEFWRDTVRTPAGVRVQNPNENALDLYQGYAEIGLLDDVLDEPSLRLRLGRQEFKMGHEYILGDRDWFNTGQAFDMARATWRPDGFEVDFLLGSPVVADNHNVDQASDFHFAGYNLQALGIPGGQHLEQYAFFKWNDHNFPGETGRRGPEQKVFFGGRAEGAFATNWDYSTEATIVKGERGGDAVDAWRFDAYLSRTFPFMATRSVRLSAVYTLASGDAVPDDGRAQQFDSLFPDPFSFHGKLFINAGTNVEDLSAQVDAKLWRGGLIELDYHHLRLQQSRAPVVDAATFKSIRRDPSGNSGRESGQAWDLQITHRFHENLALSGGVFLFAPGTFFAKAPPGNHDLSRNVFLMLRVGF